MERLVDRVDELLDKGEIDQAVDVIENEPKENKVEIEFCLGKVLKVLDENEEALFHFRQALSNQNFDCAVYAEITDACERVGKIKEAEEAYEKWLELENNPKYRWAILMTMGYFYERHHMFLKMEKIANELKENYPDNYLGYQLLFRAKMGRSNYSEVEFLLNEYEEKFSDNLVYVQDQIDYYESQEKYEDIIKYLDSHTFIKEIDFIYDLRKRMEAYSLMGNFEEAEKNLIELYEKTGDDAALVGVMLALLYRENYKEVLELEKIFKKQNGDKDTPFVYFVMVTSLLAKYRLKICSIEDIDTNQLCDDIDELLAYMEEHEANNERIESLLINTKRDLKRGNSKTANN